MAYRTVSFGVARSGLATIGYRLRASDGTLGTRVTAGVAEVVAGSGAYVANVDESSAPVGIVWDVESGSEVVAGEDFAAPTVAQIWAGAPEGDPKAEIAEAVRDVSNASPAANSLGEAVNARASQTSVDGIAAKTTNLPTSPAAVGSAMVLSSTGLDAVTVETGINARQALALIGASTAGKASGLGTTTAIFYAMGADGTTTPRVTATIDDDGNRVATTLAPPA